MYSCIRSISIQYCLIYIVIYGVLLTMLWKMLNHKESIHFYFYWITTGRDFERTFLWINIQKQAFYHMFVTKWFIEFRDFINEFILYVWLRKSYYACSFADDLIPKRDKTSNSFIFISLGCSAGFLLVTIAVTVIVFKTKRYVKILIILS